MLTEVFVIEVCQLQIVLLLTVFGPYLALALRIYEQRVPGGLGDNDSVLGRELVTRQPLKIPFRYLHQHDLGHVTTRDEQA